jgi:menaquinone-dependent protoporphyrinogen IX oxidase
MSDNILVAGASRTGSIAGVAEAIALALTESGSPAEARPMKEILDVTPHRAVAAVSRSTSAASTRS